MKRIVIAALVAACAAASPAHAQKPNYGFGGLVLNHDIMTSGDFASLTRTQPFGTARAMGMGGAFVSLGADMTSMSLNPAGLGMYRRSEFSLTPMVPITTAETPGTGAWTSNSKTRFALANIGAAINVYENATGSVTSVTLGFGMNRIADFNSRVSYSSEMRYVPGSDSQPEQLAYSIADVFRDQLQKGANTPNDWQPIMPKPDKGNPNGPLNFGNPYFWPAVLGYKGGMVHIGADGKWGRDLIGNNASILRSMEQITTGSINEFDLSFGMNFSNIVYFGATLGIQSVYKNTELVYGEEYGYFNTNGYALDVKGKLLDKQLEYSDMMQRVKLSGTGVNFKLGAIVRPVAGLRLGVAFHTPTFYSLNRTYAAGIQGNVLDNHGKNPSDVWAETDPQEDYGRNSWEFVSPSRLMLGASYTFGQMAILSVDYERDWYNGIRVKNVPSHVDFGPADYKAEFKNNFCATNALRAGLEVRPLPILALRVGGGYTSSMLKDQSLAYEMPLNTESYFFSVGAGVSLSRSVSLDVAYQNHTEKQSQYYLFYTRSNDTGQLVSSTDLFDTQLKRHFISMTLGFRF